MIPDYYASQVSCLFFCLSPYCQCVPVTNFPPSNCMFLIQHGFGLENKSSNSAQSFFFNEEQAREGLRESFNSEMHGFYCLFYFTEAIGVEGSYCLLLTFDPDT